VRYPPEVWLIAALGAFAFTGAVAWKLDKQMQYEPPVVEPFDPDYVVQPAPQPQPDPTDPSWFSRMRQYCNPVEVVTRMRMDPVPATQEGAMQGAACYALAGRIDDARALIQGLPEDQRYHAAGYVFEAGHPAADAGDDIAAGPLMELVVEFWPNHYMALYHAGAARYEVGDQARAKGYLERFLVEYSVEDGWRSSAKGMLEAIESGR
jgi:hypothetical protein